MGLVASNNLDEFRMLAGKSLGTPGRYYHVLLEGLSSSSVYKEVTDWLVSTKRRKLS